MSEVIAFDSKEFERGRVVKIVDITDETKSTEIKKDFFSPLGAGVLFKNDTTVREAYPKVMEDIAKDFSFELDRPFYCSIDCIRKLNSFSKGIAFCNRLVSELQDNIEKLFISYAIFSPKKIKSIRVGGFRCPERDVSTLEFLRNHLPQMYSYLTAWAFRTRYRNPDILVHIDNFQSKITKAWDELIGISPPKVFVHGDECDPFISLADIMAFLTDVRLYQAKKFLEPHNVKDVWEDMSFETEVRFIDEKVQSKVKWYSENPIDVGPFIARPIVFIMLETPEIYKTPQIRIEEESNITYPDKVPKFSTMVRNHETYSCAVELAQEIKGSFQFFDPYIDMNKICDNDKLIYIGQKMKDLAIQYSHMYDVEVMSARELIQETKNIE